MLTRTANASWPRPERDPEPPSVLVHVERVRRLGAANVAVAEGTTASGLPVRCLLPTELTLRLARQVAAGHHPAVEVPAWAVLAEEEATPPWFDGYRQR